jgi:hypothetical protein
VTRALGGFQVMAERCGQCLFGPDKIVSDARRQEVVRECRRSGRHFICHKSSVVGKHVCCRGFYDAQLVPIVQVAKRLEVVMFVAEQDLGLEDVI